MTVREVQELINKLPEEAKDASLIGIVYDTDEFNYAIYNKRFNQVFLTDDIDCAIVEWYEDEEEAESLKNVDWFSYSLEEE